MSEVKFTKGPWKVQDDGYGLIGVALRNGFGVLIGHKNKETIANAHLIAAAPEMYEMLIQLQVEGGLGIARHRQIDRLLKKSRGEQQ